MQILIQVMSILQTPTAVLSGSDIRAPLFSPLTTDISSEENIQDNYEGHCLTSEQLMEHQKKLHKVTLKIFCKDKLLVWYCYTCGMCGQIFSYKCDNLGIFIMSTDAIELRNIL